MISKNFLLILIFSGLFLAPGVLAQVSLGLSPLIFELTGNPNDIIENQIKVSNPSSQIVSINMTVEDIAPTGEIGLIVVEPGETETYSIAKWTKTEPEEFTLNPGEEKRVKFTISVPHNAEPGGHYGVVVAGSNQIVGGPTGSAIAPRVGAIVLMTVPGAMKEYLTIKDLTAPKYSEHGPINFSIRFENKGTVHVKPRALITITDFLGKKVTDVHITEMNVLPNAIRKFQASWNQKWLFGGRYTATLTGIYGASNIPLTPTVITFWVFPWKVGIIILIVLIFFILIRRRWIGALKVLIRGEKAIR